MPEIQFAEGILARIRMGRGPHYHERAYLFLLAAVEYLQERLDARRHVTGVELSWACRDFAHERFGLMSREVLESWGVRATADWGRIVYSLVEIGLLSTQQGDREEDFLDVYEFPAAFDESYQVVWKPE